jgi:hypothetical protein
VIDVCPRDEFGAALSPSLLAAKAIFSLRLGSVIVGIDREERA